MSSHFFIKSKLNRFVMSIKDGDPTPRAPIVSMPQDDDQHRTQLWELPIGHLKTEFHFIRSCLHTFVVDLEEFSTRRDSPVVAFPQKCEDFDNQLWDLTPGGPRARGFFFIRSRLNPRLVLEIRDGKRRPGVPIVVSPREPGVPDHQLWALKPCEPKPR